MVPKHAVDAVSAFVAKATSELDAADALLGDAARAVHRSGEPGSRVLLVKGEPGAEDLVAGTALAGRDREAARSALGALDIDAADALAVCSRSVAGADAAARGERLSRYLAASDPEVVVAIDREAAEDLGRAAGVRLAFGKPVQVRGRTLLAVDGLEASLDDSARKRRVWAQFKALR